MRVSQHYESILIDRPWKTSSRATGNKRTDRLRIYYIPPHRLTNINTVAGNNNPGSMTRCEETRATTVKRESDDSRDVFRYIALCYTSAPKCPITIARPETRVKKKNRQSRRFCFFNREGASARTRSLLWLRNRRWWWIARGYIWNIYNIYMYIRESNEPLGDPWLERCHCFTAIGMRLTGFLRQSVFTRVV